MEPMKLVSFFCLLLVMSDIGLSKPTIYMKNENDKLEPVLLAVSSTVIPIPVYQVSSHLGVKGGKGNFKKLKSTRLKPDEPTKLITGLKKMAAHERLMANY